MTPSPADGPRLTLLVMLVVMTIGMGIVWMIL
jgi:hypothetical protein